MIEFLNRILKDHVGKLVFGLFLIIHLTPIFSADIMLTLDGPAHIYNAKNFNELLFGNDFLSEYYQINPELVPNYLGHLVLSVFLIFLSPILSLKLLHVLYVVGISLVFRKLVLTISPKNELLSVLIFPFIYSVSFMSGFYNFSIAIILLFWTLNLWYKNRSNQSILFFVKLSLLFILIYFAHSFTFGILCLSLGILTIHNAGIKNIKEWGLQGSKLILSALVPIILLFIFIFSRESTPSYLTFKELINKIAGFHFVYRFSDDWSYLIVLGSVFVLLIASIRRKQKKELPLLVVSICLLLLYFISPDGVGYASVFSTRTILLCFIFLVLWLAQQEYNRVLLGAMISILFVYQQFQMSELTQWMSKKNSKSKEVLKVAELIPKNSIIFPIRTIQSWECFHVSNFLGSVKPQLILENYEAGADYFPVKWKRNLEKEVKKDFAKLEEKADYFIKIGSLAPESFEDIYALYYADSIGKKIYHTDFITLIKLK